jgi:hypothetical protein
MEQTVEAKQTYGCYASSHVVNVICYRAADNGQFCNPEFLQAIKSSNQNVTFYTVGGHHQNGIARKEIGDVTALAWTLLQHAKQKLARSHHWTFTLKYAILIMTT